MFDLAQAVFEISFLTFTHIELSWNILIGTSQAPSIPLTQSPEASMGWVPIDFIKCSVTCTQTLPLSSWDSVNSHHSLRSVYDW